MKTENRCVKTEMKISPAKNSLPAALYQNSYPNIHQPSSPATPLVVHMIHNPENPVCYYAPKHDHSHHPMEKKGGIRFCISLKYIANASQGINAQKPRTKPEFK